MKYFAIALLVAVGPALRAQTPADTGRAVRLRQHHVAHLREALGLTEDQAAKLAATEARFAGERRTILERRRDVARSLRGQLRPGIAANGDSVRKLLDSEEQSDAALAQLRREQSRELATYLTPVQQARLQLMRQRMMGRFARMGHGHHGGRGWRGEDGRHRWAKVGSG